MQSDFEVMADVDEPLERGRVAEDDEQQDLEHELMLAAESEFRESVILPGESLS